MNDKQFKKIMSSLGMSDSLSLLVALQKVAYEAAQEARVAEREACAKIAEFYEPDEKTDYVNYTSRDIRNRSNKA